MKFEGFKKKDQIVCDGYQTVCDVMVINEYFCLV